MWLKNGRFVEDVGMSDFSKLTVAEVMTRSPRSIESHQSVTLARKLMDDLRVHHLPVREAGKVVGILSDRDLNLVMGGLSTVGVGSEASSSLTVEDAMISGVHSVSASRPVPEVAKEMLDFRVGSVLVLDKDGGLLGIFTDNDALKILAEQCGA
jgi:acetoin utilization protein AcuB